MSPVTLSFSSEETSLSVREFVVREGLSTPFEVNAWAHSPNDDIDFESIVGLPASLRALGRGGSVRVWEGLCSNIEQTQAEEKGLSTYHVRIVPRLWLLIQRRNYRVFQHLSVPELLAQLLTEWQIKHSWRVNRAQHPRLEVRTQYGESDLSFVSRLLEEAGISYHFESDDEGHSQLILSDAPHAVEPRAGEPLAYVENPTRTMEREYATHVKVTRSVRPGKFTIRDFDYQRRPDYQLFGDASSGSASESALEQYHYIPGAFLSETARAGEGAPRGGRHDDREGKELAKRSLEAERADSRVVSFETNAIELYPGVIFSIAGHPRSDLTESKRLLVTELSISASHDDEWKIVGRAVFAEEPYRPSKATPKPRVYGIQSAIVVGPKDQEIYTDEHGRVRVQFHWDRAGKHDERSSCWIRVSQGWAGAGFGVMTLPRVGQEVLVGYFEGDPDQPVIIGRLYNSTATVPYKLPEHKAVSVWRSSSTPGSGGHNEIKLDDAKGVELVHIQAERDFTKLVKADEREETGGSRTINVGKRLELTTGKASLIMEGPNVTLQAAGKITVRSTADDVILLGEPRVLINPEPKQKTFKRPGGLLGEAQALADKFAFEKARQDAEAPNAEVPYTRGVRVKGSTEFRELAKESLDRLAATPTGRAALRKIARSGKLVTVMESRSMDGACKPLAVTDANRSPDGTPGKGTGSTISWNPSYKPNGAPSEIVLSHCLMRACHNARGTRAGEVSSGVKAADSQAIGLPPFPNRTLTENRARRDMKLPERARY